MNLPDDFEIIYPNMIMNNHISLGSSTNDFLNLENTKLWLGSSSNPGNVHGVRVNIEPCNSNVLLIFYINMTFVMLIVYTHFQKV